LVTSRLTSLTSYAPGGDNCKERLLGRCSLGRSVTEPAEDTECVLDRGDRALGDSPSSTTYSARHGIAHVMFGPRILHEPPTYPSSIRIDYAAHQRALTHGAASSMTFPPCNPRDLYVVQL
ncbi:unnamed protein product, partial [Rhizoctonia solani]